MKQKKLIILLSSLPFILLLYLIYVFSVDIPKWDGWRLGFLLDKYYNGTLTLYDLFMQHNEHRIFFPRLIMIPTAILTDWNEFYFMAFNYIFSLGIFIIIFLQIIITSKTIGNNNILWVTPLISLLVISFRQYENWLNGLQLVVFMSVFFTILGIIILSRPFIRPASFLGALCCGIIGSFSFLNGLLIWPIGFLILLFNRVERNLKKTYFIIWVIAGVATALLFLYDYQKPPSHHPSVFFIFKQPLVFLTFVFAYLGCPLAPGETIAPFMGITGVSLLIYYTLFLRRYLASKFYTLVPYLSMSLYSVFNALIIAIGRAGWGWQQALAPRFVTHAVFFWVSVMVILFLVLSSLKSEQQLNDLSTRRRFTTCFLVVLTLLATTTTFKSIPYFFDSYNRWQNARTELLQMKDSDVLPAELSEVQRKVFFIVRDRHLSVFRESNHRKISSY